MEPLYWCLIVVITVLFWLLAGVISSSTDSFENEKTKAKITLFLILWPIGIPTLLICGILNLFFTAFLKTEETNKPLETKTQEYINCPYCGHKLNSSLAVLKCENCGYTTNGLPVRD